MFPDSDHRNRSVWRTYLPHARYALESTSDVDVVFEKMGLLWKFGMCVYSDGRYNEAEKAFTQVMENRKMMMMMMIFIYVRRVPSYAECPETSRRVRDGLSYRVIVQK